MHRGRVVGGPVLRRPPRTTGRPGRRPPASTSGSPATANQAPAARRRAPGVGVGQGHQRVQGPDAARGRRRASTSSPSEPARCATTAPAAGLDALPRPRRWPRRAWPSPAGRRRRPRRRGRRRRPGSARTAQPERRQRLGQRPPGPAGADRPAPAAAAGGRSGRRSRQRTDRWTRPSARSLQLGPATSGARSASGAITKRRSPHAGVRDLQVGLVDGTPSIHRMSTSRVRGPQRSSRTRSAADSSRWHTPSSCPGGQVGVELDHQVQVGALAAGTTHGIGLVDRATRPPRRSATRPPRAGSDSRSPRLEPSPRKARVTVSGSGSDAHARGGQLLRDRRAQLAHRHRDRGHAGRRPAPPRRCAAASRSSSIGLLAGDHRSTALATARRSRRCRRGRRTAPATDRSTSTSRSTSNGWGRSRSSGRAPQMPTARRPRSSMRSVGGRRSWGRRGPAAGWSERGGHGDQLATERARAGAG